MFCNTTMLPLVHQSIVRNRGRSNTISHSSSSSSTRSNHHLGSVTTISATSDANNQYGVQVNNGSTNDSSECKKLKSKVCMTTNNRPFLKKRSLTFTSLFSSKSSRNASTNSLQSSLVDETIASVLKPIPMIEFLNGSNRTVSELNLNQQETNRYFNDRDSKLCKTSSTTSTLTNEEDSNLLDNLANDSFGSDLNIVDSTNQSTNELNSVQQSTNELNSHHQSNSDLSHHHHQTPSFPPPSYTVIDPKPRSRRHLLLRSQSAPQQIRTSGANTDLLFSNSHILENIQEITDNTNTELNSNTLPDVVEESEEQLDMASRRNNYLNHRFTCRLAHDKESTVTLPHFNTKEELYERIASIFKINIDQILYCTLNSLDIDHLFDRHISFNDVIYVHLRGQAKEIEIEKTDPLLGLTICDNSNGLCLIKKIKDGSVIDKIKFISVGDVVERINNINLVGYRHIEVANMLKQIPVGQLFVIRLIEPLRNTDETNNLPTQLGKQLKNKIKKGYETLRIRSKGPPVFIEEQEETNDDVTAKINAIIEDFVGISDSELVQQIMDIAKNCSNPSDLIVAINESDLKIFNFNDELILDIWGAVQDAK